MNASDEQLKIISAVENNNVVVDSVAGSGKTTTNLFIAEKYLNKKILLLTFNKKLSNETKEKIKNRNINNMDVFTYHAFCNKYYEPAPDDRGIEIALNSKKECNFNYDIIILDEAQDINELFYKFICKFISDNKSEFNLCILGDKNQSIYDFKGADSRYLTHVETIFNFNNKPWIKLKLTTSYRLTKEIADFMNECILNEKRIVSSKPGIKPEYYLLKSFIEKSTITQYSIISEILYKNKPEDVFILAPSVKSNNKNNPLTKIEQFICEKLKNLVYIPTSDDSEIDENEIKNKLVFSTFHQSKGLERKIVICYGIDESYFKFYGRDCCKDKCPNTIYVALTRASERLIIFHDVKNKYMPFINKTNITKYVTLKGYPLEKNDKIENFNIVNSVTNLIKFLPQEFITKLLENGVKLEEIKRKSKRLKIPSKIECNHNDKTYTENVSTINGIVLPMYYEYITKKNISCIDILQNVYIKHLELKKKKHKGQNQDDFNINDIDENIFGDDLSFIMHINKDNIKLNDLIKIAIYFDSYKSKYIHKTKQIKNYDWIDEKEIQICHDRFKKIIKNNADYEVRVLLNNYDENNNILMGFIDCINGNDIYEFKYVEKLKDEHILQLCIYIYLFCINNNIKTDEDLNKYNFYIFNIKYNQILKICSSVENITNIYNKIIEIKKNGFYVKLSDSDFIDGCHANKNKYYEENKIKNISAEQIKDIVPVYEFKKRKNIIVEKNNEDVTQYMFN